jgi:hypothetical protein
MAFPPATNMITNVLGHTDISESVLNYLGYDAVRSLSKVSKTVRALCDFSALLERKTARFVDGKTYVSTPTGWSHHRFKYTVVRKHARSKTASLGIRDGGDNRKGRKMVRLRRGVEYIMLGKNHKWGCIYATDVHVAAMDAQIEAENHYWSLNN